MDEQETKRKKIHIHRQFYFMNWSLSENACIKLSSYLDKHIWLNKDLHYFEIWNMVFNSKQLISTKTYIGKIISYLFLVLNSFTFWKLAAIAPSLLDSESSFSTFSRPLLTDCISSASDFNWICPNSFIDWKTKNKEKSHLTTLLE